MKTHQQGQGQAQDPRQWQALAVADPAYREWHDQRNAEDHQAFSDWLDSPEGHEWLNTQAEEQDERDGNSWWNHDGFSTEDCRYVH